MNTLDAFNLNLVYPVIIENEIIRDRNEYVSFLERKGYIPSSKEIVVKPKIKKIKENINGN